MTCEGIMHIYAHCWQAIDSNSYGWTKALAWDYCTATGVRTCFLDLALDQFVVQCEHCTWEHRSKYRTSKFYLRSPRRLKSPIYRISMPLSHATFIQPSTNLPGVPQAPLHLMARSSSNGLIYTEPICHYYDSRRKAKTAICES